MSSQVNKQAEARQQEAIWKRCDVHSMKAAGHIPSPQHCPRMLTG